MTLPLAQAAYSNPSLPPKTMMKIYRAATPDGGSNLNVLKFSQVMLENGLTLRKPSTHISPHLPYISPYLPRCASACSTPSAHRARPPPASL